MLALIDAIIFNVSTVFQTDNVIIISIYIIEYLYVIISCFIMLNIINRCFCIGII